MSTNSLISNADTRERDALLKVEYVYREASRLAKSNRNDLIVMRPALQYIMNISSQMINDKNLIIILQSVDNTIGISTERITATYVANNDLRKRLTRIASGDLLITLLTLCKSNSVKTPEELRALLVDFDTTFEYIIDTQTAKRNSIIEEEKSNKGYNTFARLRAVKYIYNVATSKWVLNEDMIFPVGYIAIAIKRNGKVYAYAGGSEEGIHRILDHDISAHAGNGLIFRHAENIRDEDFKAAYIKNDPLRILEISNVDESDVFSSIYENESNFIQNITSIVKNHLDSAGLPSDNIIVLNKHEVSNHVNR